MRIVLALLFGLVAGILATSVYFSARPAPAPSPQESVAVSAPTEKPTEEALAEVSPSPEKSVRSLDDLVQEIDRYVGRELTYAESRRVQQWIAELYHLGTPKAKARVLAYFLNPELDFQGHAMTFFLFLRSETTDAIYDRALELIQEADANPWKSSSDVWPYVQLIATSGHRDATGTLLKLYKESRYSFEALQALGMVDELDAKLVQAVIDSRGYRHSIDLVEILARERDPDTMAYVEVLVIDGPDEATVGARSKIWKIRGTAAETAEEANAVVEAYWSATDDAERQVRISGIEGAAEEHSEAMKSATIPVLLDAIRRSPQLEQRATYIATRFPAFQTDEVRQAIAALLASFEVDDPRGNHLYRALFKFDQPR